METEFSRSLYRIGMLTLLFLLVITLGHASAQDWNRIVNLESKWKFSLGDDKKRAETGFQDSGWDEIEAPAAWEEQGYYGYNGYAWYRKHFQYTPGLEKENIYLDLGFIDDVDEVYLNGKLIGSSGAFPPEYRTAAGVIRRYAVPANSFTKGDNVIAVRVYDAYSRGGIYNGELGLYSLENALIADIDLEGSWMLKKGDNPAWKEMTVSDPGWGAVEVPGAWEGKYDGFAWYRKEFTVEKDITSDKLFLMLGKIDDLDETYVNGQLIGSTGIITEDISKIKFQWEAAEFRCYVLPAGLLKKGEKNVIAVRVYDGRERGGIYQGPVGIIRQNKYIRYWKDKNKNFFKNIFGIE
ncbi:MAG: glycoside hydrolase [Ignavibacteriales bacterium]